MIACGNRWVVIIHDKTDATSYLERLECYRVRDVGMPPMRQDGRASNRGRREDGCQGADLPRGCDVDEGTVAYSNEDGKQESRDGYDARLTKEPRTGLKRWRGNSCKSVSCQAIEA